MKVWNTSAQCNCQPDRPQCSWEMLRDWSFCSAFLSHGVIATLPFNTEPFVEHILKLFALKYCWSLLLLFCRPGDKRNSPAANWIQKAQKHTHSHTHSHIHSLRIKLKTGACMCWSTAPKHQGLMSKQRAWWVGRGVPAGEGERSNQTQA